MFFVDLSVEYEIIKVEWDIFKRENDVLCNKVSGLENFFEEVK